MLKAEICAWGCGPAPFPEVLTSKSQHLCLLRWKEWGKNLRAAGAQPAAVGLQPMGSAKIHIPAVNASCGAGCHHLSYL